MVKPVSANSEQIPLNIVGSNVFGRYPKISDEQTWNMIISDNWLVPYAGYKDVATLVADGTGRGIYGSRKANLMFAVVDNIFFSINSSLGVSEIHTIDTTIGDVFMAENNANQIAICDKKNIYIWNYETSTFAVATDQNSDPIDFVPGYVDFHDGYFLASDTSTNEWRLSNLNNGLIWETGTAQSTAELSTEADFCQAVVRVPGKGNLVLVFGTIVTEAWYDLGLQLFPYQRNTYLNIDYGTPNQATIASNESMVVWLAQNKKSGPVIMYTDGGTAQKVSNDGIDFRLEKLIHPEKSYGFLFQQDGHNIYQLTFYDPQDNLTLLLDFNTQKFFFASDQDMNHHIARRVVHFNNTYYFVSETDGLLYQMDTTLTNYQTKHFTLNDVINESYEIPRIRVCKNFRKADQSDFIVSNLTFTIEQGANAEIQAVDLTISKNGGMTYGNGMRNVLNPLGKRINRFNYWQLGIANDFVPQFRFWGYGRFICTDGVMTVYQ